MSTLQLHISSGVIWATVVLLQLANQAAEIHGLGSSLMQLASENKTQAACTLALLRKYFNSGDRLTGAVLCVGITGHSPDVEEQLLQALNLHVDIPWSILTTNPKEKHKKNMQIMHEKPQCYFIVVDNLEYEDLDEIFEYWRRMFNWNPLAQFVVYMSSMEETDEEMTDLMVELLLIFMNNKLYNVNVIGQSKESSYYYGKTAFPYHPDNNCGNRVIAVDLLDACSYENGDQKDSVDIENTKPKPNLSKAIIEEFMRAKFKDKFPRDLSGCPIRAAFRGPWEPYIFVSEQADADYIDHGVKDNATVSSYYDDYVVDEAGDDSSNEYEEISARQAIEPVGNMKLTGIEYQLVQTIAERLHVSIDFKIHSINMFILFQQLIEGQIEMVVGGIDEDPSISQAVSSSNSYDQDELTWCVAKAKRKHNFFNFLASFNTNTWLLFLLFIFISSLAVLAAQHVSGYHLSSLQNYLSICIRMLGILLTQAINVNPQALPTVLRLLFFMAFLMAFFFSNTYQSFLISTLTTPTTQAQISHLEEIIDNRMSIMVSSDYVRHLYKNGEIYNYIRENSEICYNIVDCLNHAADNEHIAVVASRQHAFYNARIQRDRLYCFDRRESLYVYPVTMLLPKKYQLLHQINGIIRNIIESGHMQKWSRDLDMVRLIKEKIALVQDDALQALTLSAFRGAFVFASGLLLLASGVFSLECLVHWLVIRRRTRLRLLRCLHSRFERRRR